MNLFSLKAKAQQDDLVIYAYNISIMRRLGAVIRTTQISNKSSVQTAQRRKI
ncbi:hypothetical protein ACVQ9Z_02685 [Staphylococcus aureus]